MTRPVSLTVWPSLFDIDRYQTVQTSWEEVSGRLTTHLRTPDKARVGGFGPYALVPPPVPCPHHKGGTRATPHRCDGCVEALDLAVFDVDAGTLEEVEACDRKLSGLARCWYSSHSYHPDQTRPSLRLVLPLERPVPAGQWASFRRTLLHRYSIPARADQCSGLSHFYYLPSCPQGVEPVAVVESGRWLEVPDAPPLPHPGRYALDWTPPLVQGPVDLAPYHEELKRRARQRKDKDKALLLKRVLEGEPLAEHGARNTTTSRLAGTLAFVFPEAPVEVLVHLLRPSVQAMMAAGSSLTWAEVERMCESGLRKRAEADARDAELASRFGAFRASLPIR